MINILGVLTDKVHVCGWPWHGVIYDDPQTLVRYLKKHDGTLIPRAQLGMKDEPFNRLIFAQQWAGDFGGGTHLVKVPAHVGPSRSPEQLAADASKGHEWCDAAMLSGYEHYLYSKPLGAQRWLYSTGPGPGNRWLMTLAFDSVPMIGTDPLAALTVRITAVPFGRFQVGRTELVEPVECGSASAPSCIDTAEANSYRVSSNFPRVVIQSIRSDGAELILEVQRAAPRPSLRQIAPVGFYKLSVRKQEDAWLVELDLLKRASEQYSESVSGSLVDKSNAVAYILQSSSATSATIVAQVIEDDSEAAGPFWIPHTYRHYSVPAGPIEQIARTHCGYVYDEDDNLVEIESQVRITHSCSVPPIVPSVSGVWTHIPGTPTTPPIDDNQITVTVSQTQSVTSVIAAEVLHNGVVVSSAQTTMSVSASLAFQAVGFQQESYQCSLTGGLAFPGHTIDLSQELTDNPSLQGLENWPKSNGFSQWIGVAEDGTLVPWPGVQRSTQPLRSLFPPQGKAAARSTIFVGAVRLANNVFAPCLVCGSEASTTGGALITWFLETTDGPVRISTEMPPNFLGPCVGPKGAGTPPEQYQLGEISKYPTAEYDYLHGQIVLGGGVF